MINFPYKINVLSYELDKENRIFSNIKIGPLKKGQGLTLGNALRRTIIYDLEGIAISSLSLSSKNIDKNLDISEMLREDIFELSLNLQNIVLKTDKLPFFCEGKISNQGPKIVTGQDIILPMNVSVVNPNQYICSINENSSVDITLDIRSGKGYIISDSIDQIPEQEVEENDQEDEKKNNTDSEVFKKSSELKNELTLTDPTKSELDFMRVDSIFAPVESFSFQIESDDVLTLEQNSNEAYEYLLISLITNGSIKPFEAIEKASEELTQLLIPLKEIETHFNNFFDSSNSSEDFSEEFQEKIKEAVVKSDFQADALDQKDSGDSASINDLEVIYKYPIEKLNISKRILNSLKNANITKIGDIAELDPGMLKNIKNFGKKSLLELKTSLNEFGLWLDSSIE